VAGDRVRITAQLIYAPKDTNVWARTYERDLRDVLELQSEVASGDHQRDPGASDTAGGRTAGPGKPANPKALDAYFAGRYHLSKRSSISISSKEKREQTKKNT